MRKVSILTTDNGQHIRLKGITSYLASHPLLLAFLLNLAAFLFRIIVFDIKYEVSDDYITDAVLSGAYGTGYDPHLLFGNIILGHILVFFYKLIPDISFYFILLILLGFISCTAVLYLMFKKKINVITVSIAVVFLAFASDDLYVLIQFTKAAAAAGIAGGLLILDGLWGTGKNRVITVVLGTLLLLTGSMVRFSAFPIFCAFLVIAFIYNTVLKLSSKDKDGKACIILKKEICGILARFAVCVVIIGLMFGLNYLGKWLSYQDETHREFNSYHDIRYKITDRITPDFETVEDEYKALGLDYVDYVMLNSWNFDDRDVYPDELLVKVADLQQEALKADPVSIGDVFKLLSDRGVFNIPVSFTLYIPALLALALDRKRFYSLILVAASYAMFIGFVFYGRSVYRVEWGVYFCAASCLIAGFNYAENSRMALLKKKISGKEYSTIGIYTVILVILLLFTRVPKALDSITLLSLSDEEYRNSFDDTMLYSGIYIPDKIGFPTVKRKPSANLTEYMENDPDHYYIVDFDTGIQSFYFNYDPWIRPEQGLFSDHYAYFGGCTMRHPGEIYALKSNGCDPYNPFGNLTKENVLLVDNWGYEYKLAYIRRYYCPEAEIEPVAEIDGYLIWNVYIPS